MDAYCPSCGASVKQQDQRYCQECGTTLPGSGGRATAMVHQPSGGGLQVTGAPYPPRPPVMDDEVNRSRWIAPTGPFVPGVPTPGSTSA